jgi:SAM-dependent methyltransferase
LSDTQPPTSGERRAWLRRYRSQWDANARLDALWAVLTLEGKLGGRWNEAAFFQTGRQEIDEVFAFLERHQIGAPTIATAIDFGCGVGRLTRPLAARAAAVMGVDISPEMIRRARAYSPEIAFHLNERDDLSDFKTASVDLVYTNIVLQHLNTALQAHYIREFGRLLRSNGMAIFQIPSRPPALTRSLRTLRMLGSISPRTWMTLAARTVRERVAPWQARMELNVLPQSDVVEIARACGLSLDLVGHINWRIFYTENRFRLELDAAALDDQPEYPLSHLYFFRKTAPG